MSGPSRPGGLADDLSAPPPYAQPGKGAEHRYSLADRHQEQWGVLTLTSAARSARSTPLYYEDDSVQGTFEMEADRSDSIRSVTVTVSGSVVTGPMVDDTSVFLSMSNCLWSRKSSSLRVGHCMWPFSIALPSAVNVASYGGSSTFALPETFMERHTRVSVVYEVSVIVSRGLFRADNTFKTRFRYVPCTLPDPPSVLRQRAYAENTTLSGPRDDPAGWKTPVTAMAHGHVFKTRQAVVQCTFSLAVPLCYTRGSVIPCWIMLESGDLQALDLFADPGALSVRLRRRVRYQATALVTMQSPDSTQSVLDVASAVWWPQPTHDSTQYTRTLEGEIRLPADLMSSAEMATAQFSISYTVDVFPSTCVGFTPSGDATLMSLPVNIVTMHSPNAPRPVIYAPPTYDNVAAQTEHNNDVGVFAQVMNSRRLV
ncbi:hypothetical protein B0H17DRAFT_1011660 [Mycena rosella]|uniref:Arrestin-like N-terminal domain-containing protein n=1 Tax=Mycena rosella TaxID=1033263 RepID=A0AAD7GDY8_MYCRO|nr:hypothetical protein B0H17DRAFT_1011660 [Mycena rosella]